MKRVVLFLIIFLAFIHTKGEKLDRTYYLLGTLEDYMGRSYTKNNPKDWGYVMTLHQRRITIIKRIEEVTGTRFKKRKKKDDCSNCHEFYDLKSFTKAKKINRFYKFKKGTWTDNLGYRFYNGALICDKLNNASENNQLSFIAGLFLTRGTREGEIYKINLANSPDRFECAKQVLLKLGAEITKEEITKGMTPVAYYITFKPSKKLKTVIETEIKARGSENI